MLHHMTRLLQPEHPDLRMRNKVEKVTLTAAIGISSLLHLPADARAQMIAPYSWLNLDSPIELLPRENYVMPRPAPSAIPFRPTISASAYAAAKKAAAANYSPVEPAPFAPVPAAPPTMVFKNFSGAGQIDTTRPPTPKVLSGRRSSWRQRTVRSTSTT